MGRLPGESAPVGRTTRHTTMEPDATPPLTPGTLYLVATPIGNLEDITLRALRILRQCDLIAAEDTRRTLQLLRHFQIQKPILSCHAHNEARRASALVERLRQGATVALVTDAGSPGISDPGERVVRAVLEAGLRVEPVPGPCALIAALTASGLPTHEFHFLGFLPHKTGARLRRLESLRSVPGTLVFYESPHRIERLLEALAALYPDRTVVVARELTKKFEQFLRGHPAQLVEHLRTRPLRGECVVLVEPATSRGPATTDPAAPQESPIPSDRPDSNAQPSHDFETEPD